MQPLSDRILIQRVGDVDRIGSIYVPDSAKTRSYKGVVLAVGPGKWHPGEWWKFSKFSTYPNMSEAYIAAGSDDWDDGWQWIDGWLEPPDVHPGQTVLFSSQWNDFAARDAEGNLPLGADESVHLVQQGDIIGVIPDA